MSNKIPNASSIERGLMTQAQFNKLNSLSTSSSVDLSSISGTSLSYQSGNIPSFTASSMLASQFIINNDAVWIGANGGTDGLMLTNSAGDAVIISAGNIDIAGTTLLDSGLILSPIVSGTRVTVTDLVVINSNITGSSGNNALLVMSNSFSCSASGIQYLPLSYSIGSNEIWAFRHMIGVTGDASYTSQYVFSVFAPSGSIIGGKATAGFNSCPVTGTNSELGLSGWPDNTYNWWYIDFVVRNGSNAGDVKLGIRRTTPTVPVYVITGSFVNIQKGSYVY